MAVDFNADDTMNDLERELLRDTQRAALAGLRVLVDSSPVDTGHFRRNWRVGVGFDPQSTLARRQGGSAAETLASGADQVRRAKFGRRLFLVNNVFYGPALADGHSGKAPAGWVDRAVAVAMGELGGNREV